MDIDDEASEEEMLSDWYDDSGSYSGSRDDFTGAEESDMHTEPRPRHITADTSPPEPQDSATVDVILRFLSYDATEDFVDGDCASTLIIFYAAVRGLSNTDAQEFLQPEKYTSFLAMLIYCLRLVLLESCLLRLPHNYIGLPARPRHS
jgi:hypothetical protein